MKRLMRIVFLVMRQGQLTNEGTPEKIFSAGEALVEMGLIYRF